MFFLGFDSGRHVKAGRVRFSLWWLNFLEIYTSGSDRQSVGLNLAIKKIVEKGKKTIKTNDFLEHFHFYLLVIPTHQVFSKVIQVFFPPY